VRYRRRMHDTHIAEVLLGDAERVGEIKEDLNWLIKVGYLIKDGDGTYRPGREGPVNLNANEFLKR
jgi:hypothetical protein